MPKKKSVKRSASNFIYSADRLLTFADDAERSLTDKHISYAYEYAIIRLYREFEDLMLEALIGAINNDTRTISATAGVTFPKHLTDELCEYLIIGTGFFNFKSADHLVKVTRQYVPKTHYLFTVLNKKKYKETIDRVAALRNYAAHNSASAKTAALRVTGSKRISSCGSWLKGKGRFASIVDDLQVLAQEIYDNAPY